MANKIQVSDSDFENIVTEAYNSLPDFFISKIDNVEVIIENEPSEKRGTGFLLGLYTGIPLKYRGYHYGLNPTLPDRIFLYKNNILKVCKNADEIKEKTYEVLFHEIGHYFGMSEDEIRDTLKDFTLK